MIAERLTYWIETARRHLPDKVISIHFEQWFFCSTNNQPLEIKVSIQPGVDEDCSLIYFEAEDQLAEWIESGCDLGRVQVDGPYPKLWVRGGVAK